MSADINLNRDHARSSAIGTRGTMSLTRRVLVARVLVAMSLATSSAVCVSNGAEAQDASIGQTAFATCLACHAAEKKMIGPSYTEIAKRGYSNDRIVQLIWKPEPKNWPSYATEMAAMPQVPKGEALKIAAWINSLKQ